MQEYLQNEDKLGVVSLTANVDGNSESFDRFRVNLDEVKSAATLNSTVTNTGIYP
ncbi:MAG: hypothetical protein R2727_08650 [Bacteroidales bacterium]